MIEWMQSINTKLDELAISVTKCQARCQVERVGLSKRKATAGKFVAAAIVAAVSAIAGRYSGIEP